MNYSYNENEIVFLKDRDIATAIDGKNIAGEGILSNGVPSFDLLSAQVWSLSTQDDRLSDYIRDNVEVSCDNLSAYAKALSDEISGTVSVYNADGEYVSNHLSVLKVTNAQYNQLVADGNLKDDSIYVINDSYIDAKGQNIKNLNNPVELSDAANKTYVDDEISSARFDLSSDAAFLSATLSSLINRDKKDVTYCGDVALSTKYIDPEEGAVIQNQLYGLLLTNDPSHNRDRKLHTGFLFRASSSDKLSGFTVDDNNGNVGVIRDNDYILVANEVDAVKKIKLTDVKFIYDYTYLEDIVRNDLSTNISADVYSLSVNLSTEISALSAAISTDISVLSSRISTDIAALSDTISTDISVLSSSLSNDIYVLSVRLSTDLSVLSTMLSTDISMLSDSISATLSATSAFLCSDIQALSSDLSIVISCLSSSISSDLYSLSSDLCADIQSLSASLSGSIDDLSVKVDGKRLKLSSDISTDLSVLSAYISSDVHHLSDVMDAQIAEIKADVKGGVNYKGHIDLSRQTHGYPLGLSLSGIFGYYYRIIDPDTQTYLENKSLNNGWLYNITTDEPYTTGDNPPLVLEKNDYIIIHNHDLSCVDVSAITRDTIDIIEAVEDDYVRLNQLQALSDEVYEDITELSDKTAANDNYLSTAVSSVISLYDKDNNYYGNQLSVRKLTNAEFKDLVIHDTVNASGLYVIADYYVDAYGQQLKNLADPAELSDATNKKYVDGLVAECANTALSDLQKLSADLSTDVSGLSSGISADLKNLSASLSTDIKTLSAMLCVDVNSLSSSLCASVNAEFVHMSGDAGIGALGLTSTISAQEFVTNPVNGHHSEVKQTKLTYVDASDQDQDPKVYDISYPAKTGTIALTSDVADLSADVMSEVTYVSAELSDTVTVFDRTKNIAGNKLSTVYVTNAEYDELVRQQQIDDKVLYIIDDSYESARGQKITDLGAPTADTDAATKKYVDDTAASSSAAALENAKAYADTKAADAESNANTYTNTVSALLSSELHGMAHSSFVHISGDTGIGALQSESVSADTFTAGNDNGPYKSILSGDGVKVVDQSAHGGTPVEYKITYPLKDGVFALTSDVQDLSASLSAALSGLSSEVSALSAGIALSCEDLNKDIAYLSNDLSVLEEKHYNVTLSSMEHTSVEGVYPDNLLVVDHTHEEEQHDKYYLKFKYGTLTLVKIQ